MFNNQTCKSIGAYMEPAGAAADDWWIIGGAFKDHLGDANFRQEPYGVWIADVLTSQGLDPNISLLGWGWRYGWPIGSAQVLAIP